MADFQPVSDQTKNPIDPAAVFSALVLFRGDLIQTSESLRVPERTVAEMSSKYGWAAKLREMGVTGSSAPTNKQDAVARLQNRAMNFVQAIRLRELVDRLALEMLESPEKLTEFTTVVTKNGTKRDMRTVVDLVNAANVAQAMTARALQDHKDNEAGDREAMDGNQLSLAVGAALDAAMSTGKPSSELVRELPGLEPR